MSTSDKLLALFGLFTLEEHEWTVEAAAERLGLAMSSKRSGGATFPLRY